MSLFEFLNNAIPLIALIVVGGIVFEIVRTQLKHKHDMAKLNAVGESSDVQQLKKTIQQHEERLAVLERIATDRSERLRQDLAEL